jgi:hypothetical protein
LAGGGGGGFNVVIAFGPVADVLEKAGDYQAGKMGVGDVFDLVVHEVAYDINDVVVKSFA